LDQPGEAVPIQEVLMKLAGPVGIRKQADLEAPVSQRPQHPRRFGVMADVRGPGIEVVAAGFGEHGGGHVEPDGL